MTNGPGMKLSIVGAMIFLAGCMAEFSGHLIREERAQVIMLAIQRVEESNLLNGEELAHVRAHEPRLSYYFLAGKYDAQYSVRWALSETDEVCVFSTGGNIMTLEGAKIERRKIQPPKAKSAYMRTRIADFGEHTRLACAVRRPAEHGSEASGETPDAARETRALRGIALRLSAFCLESEPLAKS
jgi:hypothetical protein